jgi:DNA-directed RNA polymerase subunit RPC12/RpoP
MAPIQTHVAHCGACSGRMMMRTGIEGIWFVCLQCGEETPPRLTLAEADDDVVWVPMPPTKQRNR